MAKDYTAAINEIMPLVQDGDSSTPFIISRDSAYKDWQVLYPYPAENADSFLESQKAHDPCALMFTGRDFSKGSFAYVCDKVLLMRLFVEEEIILNSREADIKSGAFDNNKLDEFCDCLEDYISELSQVTVDYLTSRDNPLEWLYDEFVAALDLSKQHIADTFDGEPFDETLKSTLFAAIDERCAYEMNPDKDLIDKMREDYACRNEGDKGLYNLLKYVEQHGGAISNDAKDYLLSIDSPLSWLGVQLYDSYHKQLEVGIDVDNGMNGGELILAIEQVVEGEQMDIDYEAQQFNDDKINDFDPTHCISSIVINGCEIELGEDTAQAKPFYVEASRNGEYLFDMRTEKYGDALKAFSTQILARVSELSFEREDKAVMRGVDFVRLTDENCLPDGKNSDFTGQLIVVDANSLLPEYRSSENQLVECTHGNGARPDAIGTSVFGKELYTGKSVVYGRHQILGIADETKLPQWAKTRLECRRDPAIFEFGGFHFKPHRSFEKRDGDFHDQMHRVTSERGMGISTYEWSKTDYSHAKFYEAANSDADIFKCLENEKLYIPGENELFRYDEPPQILTFAEQHKACAKALDEVISEVRTAGEMAGTATYDLKSALNTFNEKFSKECVAEVLAAIVSAHDYDGRYSSKNKTWAAAFDSVTIEDTQHSIRYCTVNTHPTILDGLVSKIRETAEKSKDERPDFLEKLDTHKQKSERDNANRETPQKHKKRGDMEVD